jgi:hypothetical protein
MNHYKLSFIKKNEFCKKRDLDNVLNMTMKNIKILNDIHEMTKKQRQKNYDIKYLRDQNLSKLFIELKNKI